MLCALALPAVASLLAAASVDVDAGLRAEGTSSVLAPLSDSLRAAGITGPQSRVSLAAEPRAAATVEGDALLLRVEYAPRVWTSDVAERPSPLVLHRLGARLETRADERWRAGAAALGTRGDTDPFADAAEAAANGATQVGSTAPVLYETLRAGGHAEVRLDQRTTVTGAGAWAATRGVGADGRAAYPEQRSITAATGVTRLVSPVDTLRIAADATGAVTSTATGDVQSAFATGSGNWRERLTTATEGWVGGGAALAAQRGGGAPSESSLLPFAEVGVAYATEQARTSLEASAKLGPAVDRFTGQIRPMVEAVLTLRRRASARVMYTALASGGRRTDGETSIAAWDARVRWEAGERLAFELGILGRWQNERRPELPSFVEGGVVAAVVWGTRPATQ